VVPVVVIKTSVPALVTVLIIELLETTASPTKLTLPTYAARAE
jgi:hypothetical protein